MLLCIYVAALIVIVLGVLWGFSFYLVKKRELNIKDWFRNSLGVPRGSVRAIIGLAFISALIYSSLAGVEIPDMPDWAVGIAGSVVGFYFGAATNRRDKEEETTTSTATNEASEKEAEKQRKQK